MKNLFRIFAVVAAAAMTFACSDDNGAGVEGFGTHTVTFIAGGDDTRTEIVENGESVSYKWTAGDEERFHVYENGKAAKTTTVEFSDDYKFATVTATFDNTEAAEFTYTATVAAKLSNAGNPLIPAEQTPAENSFDPAADVLVADPVKADAAVTEPVKFRFARVAAVSRATLKGFEAGETVKTVELTSDKQLSQHFTGVDASGPKYSANSKTLTLTVDREAADGAVAVYFTSAPVESTAFSVRVVTDKNVYTKELALSAEKTLAFTLENRTGFTVNLAGCGEPIAEPKEYTLVETQDDLFPGATYLIVAANANYAMGVVSSNNRNHAAVGITKVEKTITIKDQLVRPVQIALDDNDKYVITYTTTSDNGEVVNYLTNQSASNYLGETTSAGTAAEWTIAIADGVATIKNVERTTYSVRYNSGNSMFACYTSGQGDVALYVDKTTCVEDTTPRIIASADVVNVSGDGETFDEVTVATKYVEGAVEVAVPAEAEDWIFAHVADGKLDMIVEPNTTGEERSTVLTLSAEGAESVEITVKQAAIVPEITIADADKTLSVPAEGVELQSIKVTTANLTEDVTVTVEPASEWLVADYNAANGTLDIMVEANADAAERKATVTLSANGVSAAVEVVQEGKVDLGDTKFVEFVFSEMGIANAVELGTRTKNPITIAGGGSTAPKYYNTGSSVRLYAGSTLTISGTDIVRIEFNYGSTKNGTATVTQVGTGTFVEAAKNQTAVWTGNATSVTYSNASAQTYVASVKIYYTGGESGPTQLAAPEVNATSTSSSVTLTWAEVPGAGGYEYTVGTVTGMTFDTSVTVGDLAEGTYDWSVTAISEDTANYTDSEPATGSVTVSSIGSGDEPAWVEVTDFSTITTGKYIYVAISGTTNYYMSNVQAAVKNVKPGTMTALPDTAGFVAGQNMVLIFTGDQTNGFTISNESGDYLGATSSNDGVSMSSSNSTTKWVINANSTCNFTIKETAPVANRYLGLYTTSNYRTYSSEHANITGSKYKLYRYND